MLNIIYTIRELQVETMRYHYTPIKMAKFFFNCNAKFVEIE